LPDHAFGKLSTDPEESLIPDPRAGLTPAEVVRRKLAALLCGGRERKGE
jgi:hypothetical protein